MTQERDPRAREGNEIIQSETIRLDYGHFERKSFVSCTLVYAGGGPPTMIECDFLDCRFALEGAALQTVQFLGGLANGGGKDVVFSMLGIQNNG